MPGRDVDGSGLSAIAGSEPVPSPGRGGSGSEAEGFSSETAIAGKEPVPCPGWDSSRFPDDCANTPEGAGGEVVGAGAEG